MSAARLFIIATAALPVLSACDDPTGGAPRAPDDGVAGIWTELVAPALPGAGAIEELALEADPTGRLHLAVRRGGRVHVLRRQADTWVEAGGGPVTEQPAVRMALALAGSVPVVATVTGAGELRVHHFTGAAWTGLGNMDVDLGGFPRVSAAWDDVFLAADAGNVFVGFVDEFGRLALRHFSIQTGSWTTLGPPGDEVSVLGAGVSAGPLNGLVMDGAGLVLVYRTIDDRSAVARLEDGIWVPLSTFPEGARLTRPSGRPGAQARAWFAAQVDEPGRREGRLFNARPAEVAEHPAGPFAAGLELGSLRVAFDGAVPLVSFQVLGPGADPRRDEVVVLRPVGGAWSEVGDEGAGRSEPGMAAFAFTERAPHVALARNDPAAGTFTVSVLRFEPSS